MPKFESTVVFASRGFAVPTLEALAGSGRIPKLIVVREGEEADTIESPELTSWAEERGVEIARPDRLRGEKLLERLRSLELDFAISLAYGRGLPPEILELAKHGGIALHPSLLPKYRGAAPIRRVLAAGEKKTGVTVTRIEEEPLKGPVLLQEELEIGEAETYGELHPRLAERGAKLLLAAIAKVEKNPKTKGKSQNEKAASKAPRVDARHRKAPWFLEAGDVYNRLRAYAPRPGLETLLRLQPLRILQGKPLEWVQAPYGETGTFLGMRQGRLAVLCSGGTVFGIELVERPDGEPQRAGTFAAAEKLTVGDRFI